MIKLPFVIKKFHGTKPDFTKRISWTNIEDGMDSRRQSTKEDSDASIDNGVDSGTNDSKVASENEVSKEKLLILSIKIFNFPEFNPRLFGSLFNIFWHCRYKPTTWKYLCFSCPSLFTNI